jgi:hypothetical protein
MSVHSNHNNGGVFFGSSSKLIYDNQAYKDQLSESVSPLLYKLNPNQINNCSGCLSVFGPRTSTGAYSFGVSTTSPVNRTAIANDLVDVESILSNRNVLASKCKDGKLNPIDITQFQLQHPRTCNSFLDPIASHLTNPAQEYRGAAINRFYDLNKPAQANIFWNFAVNTKLEAIDNFRERIPRIVNHDPTLPRTYRGSNPGGYDNIGCPKGI